MIAATIEHPLIFPLVAADVRAPVARLWQLDARLAQLALAGREPALRQIRLAWWRDRLAAIGDAPAPAEPLLAAVADELAPSIPPARLAALAEAWMAVVAEEDGAAAWRPRGHALYALTTDLLGTPQPGTAAGAGWSMVDGALMTAAAADAPLWSAATAALAAPAPRLPRALAALDALARTIARARGRRRAGREQWAILRAGLTGR